MAIRAMDMPTTNLERSTRALLSALRQSEVYRRGKLLAYQHHGNLIGYGDVDMAVGQVEGSWLTGGFAVTAREVANLRAFLETGVPEVPTIKHGDSITSEASTLDEAFRTAQIKATLRHSIDSIYAHSHLTPTMLAVAEYALGLPATVQPPLTDVFISPEGYLLGRGTDPRSMPLVIGEASEVRAKFQAMLPLLAANAPSTAAYIQVRLQHIDLWDEPGLALEAEPFSMGLRPFSEPPLESELRGLRIRSLQGFSLTGP